MANIDLPILSVKLNGVEKITEFKNNDLWMTSTDVVRIQFDGTKRMKSDNEFIGIAMGFDDGGGSAPYSYPDIYGYINGVRTKIRDARDSGASTLVFIYSKSIVDNIVEFSGRSCNFTFANITSYDGYATNNVIVPTISISSKKIKDNPTITLTSTSDKNGYLKAQLWQDGILISEQSKTSVYSSSYKFTFTDIPFVSANDLTVKMLNKKEPEDLSAYIDSYNILTSESTITGLESIDPIISDFLVIGTSIDNNIVCSWTQEDVESWIVQAIQNGVVKSNKSGTGTNTCSFNQGELLQGGKTTFKISARNKYGSTSEETAVDLSYTQAKATLIDIPGITININEKFTIAWVSENQTSFVLTVDGKTYTGTTEKSITLPPNTISKGNKTISLAVTFTNAYYSNSNSVSTAFTAYGKPSTPMITNKSIVSSALPYITWTSTEQVVYLVVIKKLISTVETSGEVLSQSKYYLVSNALENNTTYKAIVKVKNQYGLWSEVEEFEFSTQFTVPNTPTITAISDTTNGAIILNVNTDTEGDAEYKNTEIWKREPLGEWKRMAYNLSSDDAWSDFYVGNNVEYEYKARNIGQTGGISESDVIVASTIVKGYTFYNVEDLENKFVFKYDVEITPKLVTNMVTNLFAGAEAPQTSTDGIMYWNCSISFKSTERNDILKIIKLMKNSKVLLFKDCRGHKYFGNIIGSPSFPETDLGIISIQIEFTETSFLEQDVYRGDNTGLKLIKWDGTWRFNGTQSYHS